MEVEKFSPEINRAYIVERHTLIHILSGEGSIEVDFKHYSDWQEKAIFLEKGQYIKFLSGNFLVRRIQFFDEDKFYNDEVRVLFKHLIALGYINLMECAECQFFLSESMLAEHPASIIDVSSQQWYWQNPFGANREEYQVIFDVKDIIDKEFSNHLTSNDLADLINDRGYNALALVRDKVGMSVKHLMGAKRLKTSQREVAFTDKNIQEIAYDLGFRDVGYFNRVFKKSTGWTPKEFRENFDYPNRNLFAQDILDLIRKHHAEKRSLEFYADKMNLSVKGLNKKVRAKLNNSLGQLIRLELINTAKLILLAGESPTSVAHRLGFEEANHFSRFFKRYTGASPSQFRSQKSNL